MREAIAAKQVDLVITNPGYYVTLEAQFGLSRIATLQSPHAARSGQALGSVVLARAERTELVKLRDLAGRSIAAVAPEAFGGYLIAAREMLRDGVDPESAVRETRFLGLPMTRIVEAVIGREVDAGIVRACLPEQMAREGRITSYNVCYTKLLRDGETAMPSIVGLFTHLVEEECRRDDLRQHWRHNTELIALRITEHVGHDGEHFITETRREDLQLAGAAAIGGLVIGVMACIKLLLGKLGT